MTMRLLSMSVGLSDVTSDARKPAPYATLNAALYLSPGAASRKRETSSGLKTTGSLWGWRTNGRWLAISVRPSVTRKKNRSPDTVLFMLAAEIRGETKLKATHILVAGRVRRAAEKHSQAPDAADIVVVGLRPEIADRHVFDHAPA